MINRAHECCEYCLIPQDTKPELHQIDHIIARKHGGQNVSSNLALACTDCNLHKGSDITTLDPEERVPVSLFDPRTQRWHDHFELVGVQIVGRTAIGRATVTFLRLNDEERLLDRQVLIAINRYPPLQSSV